MSTATLTYTPLEDSTTVGEALERVPGALEIFEQHGCIPNVECTEHHLEEYTIGDTELTCHVDDTGALLADLNAVLAAESGEYEPAAETEPAAAYADADGWLPSSGLEPDGTQQRAPSPIAETAPAFDVMGELASLQEEPSWLNGDRNARTLVSAAGQRVLLTAMKAGAALGQHPAPGPSSIFVLDGALRVTLAGESLEVGPGALLALDAGTLHAVEALEESAFLLTVADNC